MKVVVNVESEEREVLGIFTATEDPWDEGLYVRYNVWEDGSVEYAPADCVEIVEGFILFHGPGGLKETIKK